MNVMQIEDYRLMYREGSQYLRTAEKAFERRREVFTPEIIYNLASMAIEKFFMSFLYARSDMADNHTMRDLIGSVERHIRLEVSLVEKLLYLDSFQSMCDPNDFSISAPGEDEIPAVLAMAVEVRDFVETVASTPTTSPTGG